MGEKSTLVDFFSIECRKVGCLNVYNSMSKIEIHRVSRHTVISNLLLTKGRGKVRFCFMLDLLSIYTAIYDSITNF